MMPEDVLQQQPFQHVTRFIDAKRLPQITPIGGITYKVLGENKKYYKLRLCNNLSHALEIERNVQQLPQWFPTCYGRQGRYLLFDWIDGTTLPKEVPPPVCYLIGKMMGEAHALNDIKEKNYDEWISNRLFLTPESFSDLERETIVSYYLQQKAKLKIDIVLEFHDVHQGNMVLDKDGRLFFVDEDGFGHKLKGLGLAKPLFTSKFIHTDEQKTEFWRGYHEHASTDFFTKDYQILVEFMQLVRSLVTKKESPERFLEQKLKILSFIAEQK